MKIIDDSMFAGAISASALLAALPVANSIMVIRATLEAEMGSCA